MATTAVAPVEERRSHLPRGRRFDVVWLIAGLAVICRLPFVGAPAGADEAGFLQVAHQWARGGGSLYGGYWVDRPPLLISIYQVADATGGLVALRVIGCVAVAVTVVLCARSARLLAGDQAATWAATAAAAMLVSPLMGGPEINGELLAAPFVAAGIAALVEASRSEDRRHAVALAGLAGAAGVCALLVKQNVVDVVVFGSVYLLAGLWRGRRARSAAIAAAALVGGFVACAMVAAWTVAHGTSLTGVFDAMYPFRWQAAHVLAAEDSQYARGRAVHLATAFALSGAGLLTASVLLTTARRRAWDAAVIALAAASGYDALSIAFGGGYWLHYLIECVVPLAVWAGVLIGRGVTTARLGPLAVTVATMVTLALDGLHPFTSSGAEVGAAIGRVAQPGDTLTTMYGEASVNFAARLPSPYQHLWSLPLKTLDPHLTGLDNVLAGPTAPTWLVVIHHVDSWGLDSTTRTEQLIADHYRPVARIDGQTIYLHDGLDRLTPSSNATGTSVATSPTTQEQP